MPNQTITIANTRRTNYDGLWGANEIKGVDEVDPSGLVLMLDPVRIGSLGKMKLDDRFVGLEDGAKITIAAREITRTLIEWVHPWYTATNHAAIDLAPPMNTLMASAYAQELILHPRDKSDTSEDLRIYKCVPAAPAIKRDGIKDDLWLITFWVFPDLTKLPANPYGNYKA